MTLKSLTLILLVVILTACQSGSLPSPVVVPTDDIINVSDFRWDGIVDTYVTAWYPDTSYGKETTLWVRPGQHFILMQFDEDVAGVELTTVSRTNEQAVTLKVYRWLGPVTDGMTYNQFAAIRAESTGDLLESVVINALRPYQVGLYKAQKILIEAEGGGVGYGIASTNASSKRPVWHPWNATPTPAPTATRTPTLTPTATLTQTPTATMSLPPVKTPTVPANVVLSADCTVEVIQTSEDPAVYTVVIRCSSDISIGRRFLEETILFDYAIEP